MYESPGLAGDGVQTAANGPLESRLYGWIRPLVLIQVVDDEIVIEVPIGPGPATFLGCPSDCVRVRHARIHRTFVISAELPQQNRTVFGRTPKACTLIEILCEGRTLF